jgi:hypothetical protein
MRTSGGGGEGWMTAIPIAVIVLFAVIASGGPKGFLKSVERQLRSTVEWSVQLVR